VLELNKQRTKHKLQKIKQSEFTKKSTSKQKQKAKNPHPATVPKRVKKLSCLSLSFFNKTPSISKSFG